MGKDWWIMVVDDDDDVNGYYWQKKPTHTGKLIEVKLMGKFSNKKKIQFFSKSKPNSQKKPEKNSVCIWSEWFDETSNQKKRKKNASIQAPVHNSNESVYIE